MFVTELPIRDTSRQTVARVLWFLFSSGGATIAFLLAGIWVVASRGSRASRRVLLLVAAAYWVAGTYLVPATIKRLIAWGYAPISASDVPHGRTAVVLLGSGSFLSRDWAGRQYTTVDRIGASRVVEAARVYHLLDADFVISSGGLIETNENSWPSGLAMADALVSLGVPRDRIIVEDESGTTRDEAVIVKRLLAARPVDHLVLVTSPVHMRRSVGVFRAEGITVIPAIARETPPFDRWWAELIPTDKGLEESGMAAHELAGLAVYYLHGWYK